MMSQTRPLVSIVVPCYNEASYIGRLLSALVEQTYPNLEVIISDAESNDETSDVVEHYIKKLNLHVVHSPPGGPGRQRNIGANKARGEWLLFLDADVDIDDKNFVKTLLFNTTQAGWKTSTARLTLTAGSLKEKVGTLLDYHYIKLLRHTKHPVAPGWCILTRRDIFLQNKGFNEKIFFGEDYDYVSRVGKYGFGFGKGTYYYIDLRRVHEEGFSYVYKGVMNEIYRHTHGYNLEKSPYAYRYGKHK